MIQRIAAPAMALEKNAFADVKAVTEASRGRGAAVAEVLFVREFHGIELLACSFLAVSPLALGV